MKASAMRESGSKMESGAVAPKSKGGRKAKSKSTRKDTSVKRSARGNGHSTDAAGLLARGKTAVSDAYGWAADSAERVMPGKTTFQNMMQEKPFVVGAIGLGIGAIIGMLLPDRLSENLSLPTKRSSRK